MTRTPEPELMVEVGQAAAYAAANLSEVNEPMAGWFQARFPRLAAGARLLDIGCGTADFTIRLVQAYPGITALGIDGSAAMLQFGRELVSRAMLESRIVLEHRYFPDPELERTGFDAVTANSILHHVADTYSFWRAVRRCARPGAPVMVADLRRPPDVLSAAQIVEKYASRAQPPLQRDLENSLHAAYTVEEVEVQLRDAGLEGFTVEAVGALQWVAWGFGA